MGADRRSASPMGLLVAGSRAGGVALLTLAVFACGDNAADNGPLDLLLDVSVCLGPVGATANEEVSGESCRAQLDTHVTDAPTNACLVIEQIDESERALPVRHQPLRWNAKRLSPGLGGMVEFPLRGGDRIRAALFLHTDGLSAPLCAEGGLGLDQDCDESAGCVLKLSQSLLTINDDGTTEITFRDQPDHPCNIEWSQALEAQVPETCDGVDNDCDSLVDEAVEQSSAPCPQQAGVCQGAREICGGAAGWLACDDETYALHSPDYKRVETADDCDALDNDCNGTVDDDCACAPGQQQGCVSDTGACEQGTQICGEDLTWGPCVGEVAARDETCNGIDDDCDGEVDEALGDNAPPCPLSEGVCLDAHRACGGARGWLTCGSDEYGPIYREEEAPPDCDQLDNDCDGTIDEGCACRPGTEQSCGPERGACVQGTQSCVDGEWGPCLGGVGPAPETCNGLDDDCDGQTDDNAVLLPCPLQLGVCLGAQRRCAGGAGLRPCTDETYADHSPIYVPIEDHTDCDGRDNDCDGFVDEACPCEEAETIVCGVNLGQCSQGAQICRDGSYDECDGAGPTREICDGVDNDCDGQIDEGVVTPLCPLQHGVCAGARRRCEEGDLVDCENQDYGPLYDASGEQGAEALCDTFDNNCDRQIDEGCDCDDGDEQRCGREIGQCTRGRQTCAGGRWGECDAVRPSVEICDGIDNDCNDAIDDALDGPGCPLQLGVCAGARKRCGGDDGWLSCTADVYSDHHPRYSTTEGADHCDGLDNDCNGLIDEACECSDGDLRPCGQSQGQCTIGEQLCTAGRWGPCDGVAPADGEICDGVDNDCDGESDEAADLPRRDCPLQQGVCSGARERCVGGRFVDCDVDDYGPAYTPSGPGDDEPRCDTFDNDCDGQVDEGCECTDGARQACGSNLGACTRGEQICRGGEWGACSGVGPTDEICNGIDDNCDQGIDEGLAPPLCALQAGICFGSTESCGGDAGWVPCRAEHYQAHNPIYVAFESLGECDGADNDCDGQADEGCGCENDTTRRCGVDQGICTSGEETCVNGEWSVCDGVGAGEETCNGLDDDCDGQADQRVAGELCPRQSGVCAGSRERCVDGQLLPCDDTDYGLAFQTDETFCDGRDNDCDGDTDEECDCVDNDTEPCGIGLGHCAPGTRTCRNGRWGECEGQVIPQAEICDGLDNDCNGRIDDNLFNRPSCDLTLGVCAGSRRDCVDGAWLACDQALYRSHDDNYRSAEGVVNHFYCDGRDNDCDGATDEGCLCVGNPTRVCGTDIGQCEAGQQACELGSWSPCLEQTAPQPESHADRECNGLDDNCDGLVDEMCSPP